MSSSTYEKKTLFYNSYIYIYIYIYIYRERERERERQTDGQTDRDRERQRDRERELVGWLVGIYGISTFVCYFVPNPF